MTEPTSPLQISDFRLYWLSRFASVVGTIGMVVIIGYQLYDVARSQYGMSVPEAAFQLGLLGLAQFVPLAVFTPVAGVVADRFDRRTVAIIANALDLCVALALALVTQLGMTSLPLLFTLAALHGTARVFIGPALSAVVPNIVPAPLIPRAMALSAMSWQAGAIGGPAMAGLLYGLDHALPYWTSAALLAVSCFALFAIRRLPPPEGNRDVHPVRQVVEGCRYVWNERFLLGCISLDLFAVLLGGATALLPVFARDILQVGPQGLGIMRAAPAVGAIVVSVWLSARPLAHNVGAKMLWAVAAFGAVTIGFGLSRNFALSLGLLAMLGATGAVAFGGVGAIVITALWAVSFPDLRRATTVAPHYRTLNVSGEPP